MLTLLKQNPNTLVGEMKANNISGTRPRLLTLSGWVPCGDNEVFRQRNFYATIARSDGPRSTLLPSIGPVLDITEIAAAQEWLETLAPEDESESEGENENEITAEIAMFGNAIFSVK